MKEPSRRARRSVWTVLSTATIAVALLGVSVTPAAAQEPGEVLQHTTENYDCYTRLEKRTGTDTWTGIPEYRVTLQCSYIAEGWDVHGVLDAVSAPDAETGSLTHTSPKAGAWYVAQSSWDIFPSGIRGTRLETTQNSGALRREKTDLYDCVTWFNSDYPEAEVSISCSYVAPGTRVRGVLDVAGMPDHFTPWITEKQLGAEYRSGLADYRGEIRGTRVESDPIGDPTE